MVAHRQSPPRLHPHALSQVARQIGIGLVIVGAASLLTLLFSFLGTITAAALLGMVFGTIQPSKWRVGLVSLAFPLVSVVLSHLPTADKTWALSSLCFGVFWASYWLTRGALYLEATPAAVLDQRPGQPLPGQAVQCRPPGAAPAPSDPHLAELQGRWLRQSAGSNRNGSAEAIEITQDQVVLMVLESDRGGPVVRRGQIQVRQVGPYKVAVVRPENGGLSLTGNPVAEASWLYRVVGEHLTIAWHFEQTSTDPQPVFATYRRKASDA